MGFFSWLLSLRKPKKVKLGLALGSGGAKGFAELGAIRAFEENGIEFDVIAGTSIGSIIGAFYADGYTSTDIVEMLKRINVTELISGIGLGIDMSGLERVIDKNIGHKNIEELKKPFACVATDTATGKECKFEKGSVAKALCASSSMPPYFKPVIIDGVRYVDGAFTNSIPADWVRAQGANYVVGIDLKDHDAKPSFISRLIPTYRSDVSEPWATGYRDSDVMVYPNLKEYKATSFTRAQEMFDLGYEKAMELMPKIKQDIENLKGKKKKTN